jgi:tetratricopeptide (TPR) repeat protein
MPASSLAALLASLVLLAAADKPPGAPAKQSWDSANPAEAQAGFLPRSALLEVDGQPRGGGFVTLDASDAKRSYRIRITAEGFEPLEATVEAGQVANKQYFLALRPIGFEKRVEARDAASMALAASALWKAGRLDDAADYAEQSLRCGNTPLANRILGEVWRKRGNRDQAVRYFTMFLSITDNAPEAPEIKAWLMQDRPGDIVIP